MFFKIKQIIFKHKILKRIVKNERKISIESDHQYCDTKFRQVEFILSFPQTHEQKVKKVETKETPFMWWKTRETRLRI